jgi:two-component system, sensor histidine kinase and response regulator
MKVLLAEDNLINRKLATTLLEKHGYAVVSTVNGREALDALERETPDAVLMDVQMPVMDGLEAIRTIRAKEQCSGVRLPIIVLTAHAMKGDRERCFEAGADDYLTKPIRTNELLAALRRLEGRENGGCTIGPPHGEKHMTNGINVARALERVEGDRELLDELIRLFIDECPKNMAEIRSACEAHDARLLERVAHTIKGSAASLCAEEVSEAAFALEKQARAGDFAAAGEKMKALEIKVEQLLPECEALLPKKAH